MPRILEIGPITLFGRTHPNETVRFWTGDQAADALGETPRRWGPRRLVELRRALTSDQFDVVVCHAPFLPLRPWDPLHLAYELAFRRHRAPLIGLDMNDYVPLSPTGLRLLDHSRVFFKRELPFDRSRLLEAPSLRRRAILERNAGKIRPISLGLGPWRIAEALEPPPEKTTDVFFSGTLGNDVRRRAAETLERLAREGVRVDRSTERLERAEYLRRTAEAYLTLSPQGLGWQCFRHFEAAACRSVPVMDRPYVEMPHPLVPGEHCLQYDADGDELAPVIREALADKSRLVRMGRAARKHVLEHHLHESLARSVLAELDA